MKKLISAVLALCLLLSLIPASARYLAPTLPQTGVIADDDFEDYSINSSPTSFKNGGIYQRAHGVVKEDDGNKYYTFPIKNNQLLCTLEDFYGAGSKVETGKLKIQYDVKLDEGKKLTFVDGVAQNQRLYLMTYGADGGWSKDDKTNRAFYSSVRIGASENADIDNKPYIAFNDKNIEDSMASINDDKSNVKFIDFGKWYTVTTVVDYDLKEVNHYVNGEKITYYKGAQDASMIRHYQFSWLTFNLNDDINTGEPFEFDNFSIERLGSGILSAEFAGSGEDYIDIAFDKTVEQNSTLDTELFTLKKLGSDEEVHPVAYSYLSGSTMRFTFENALETGTNYEFYINATVQEVGNKSSTLPAGTMLFFATDAEKETYTLVDNDFENASFPETAEDGENFADFAYYGKASENGTEFERAGSLTSKYIKKNTDKFAGTDGKGSVMQVFHSDAYPVVNGAGTQHKSVIFPFADGREISGGKVTSEFDMYFVADELVWKTQFAFGLHDTTRTADNFNWNGTWTNATLFAGLTDWSHYTSKTYVAAREPDRAYIRGYYLPNGKAASDWDESYYKSRVGYSTTNVKELAAWHRYKFVVDLDEGNFEIFLDGKSEGKFDYLPGGVSGGSYDGLVITSVDDGAVGDPTANGGQGGKYRGAVGNSDLYSNCYYIDNVKVTYDAPQPIVIRNAQFKGYDGSANPFSSIMSAGTKKAVLTFSKELDPSQNFAEFAELDGENGGYTVYADGKELTVDFTNCLKPQTEYTLRIKSGISDANGAALAKDVEFKFMTDEGEIKFSTPVIMKGSTPLTSASQIADGDLVTATVNVINTTSDGKGAYVVLLAYKDGYLTAVAHEQYVPTVDRMYSEDISVNITAEGGFVGADSVKAIAFDTLSGVHPLCDATEVK